MRNCVLPFSLQVNPDLIRIETTFEGGLNPDYFVHVKKLSNLYLIRIESRLKVACKGGQSVLVVQ